MFDSPLGKLFDAISPLHWSDPGGLKLRAGGTAAGLRARDVRYLLACLLAVPACLLTSRSRGGTRRMDEQ